MISLRNKVHDFFPHTDYMSIRMCDSGWGKKNKTMDFVQKPKTDNYLKS